jgi:hypothetical protein
MFTVNICKGAQSAQCALAPYFQQLRTNACACNVHSNVHNVHFSTSYRGSPRLHTPTSQTRACRGPRLLHPSNPTSGLPGSPRIGNSRATSKILLSQVHEVHSAFAFMKLGGELVTFPHVHEVHDVHEVHELHDVQAWMEGLLSFIGASLQPKELRAGPSAEWICFVSAFMTRPQATPEIQNRDFRGPRQKVAHASLNHPSNPKPGLARGPR